jgi:hypothetical protein
MSDVTRKADPGSPGGSAPPGAGVSSRRMVEQLDEAACLELLSTGRIGRLIYNSRYGPVAPARRSCAAVRPGWVVLMRGGVRDRSRGAQETLPWQHGHAVAPVGIAVRLHDESA